MKSSRRTFLSAAAAFALVPHPGIATPFLDLTARIVVGAAPGGGTDIVARLLAEQLAGRYAPQVIVENKPGASSRIGAEFVKAAEPDGATCFLSPLPVLSLFPHTLPRTTQYNPFHDFMPVSTVGALAYGLAVKADNPVRNLADFIAIAIGKGSMSFAPPVRGAPQHLLMLAFARQAGLTVDVVPFRNSTQAMQEVLAGRIDCTLHHMAELTGHVEGGAVRLLAVTSARRLAKFPNVPTFAELGFPRFTSTETYSIVVPQRTPERAVHALHRAIVSSISVPHLHRRLEALAIEPFALAPAELAAELRRDHEAWRQIVQETGFNGET